MGFTDELLKEAGELKDSFQFSKAYRKKKLLIWCVRTILTIIIYVIFWEYPWLRWTLIIYIPLSLFNLFTILGWNFLLNRKIRNVKKLIEAGDK